MAHNDFANWNLSAWLTYLETLHPKAIDLGLERVKQVAQKIGLTHPAKTVITVAGTNGKGTVVTSLSSIYHQAGYKVAAYTSPHLWNFNERIVINSIPIAEQELCRVFLIIEKARASISLTYFEFTTLAALLLFQEQSLDIAILEVGMGGRLDAVNIIDPDITVITTIDLDHQAWLGDTREKIGYEKAGICREHIPLVCGRNMPESILEKAHALNAPVYVLDHAFKIERINSVQFAWHSNNSTLAPLPKGDLLVDNIALSLEVVDLLMGQYPVNFDQIVAALKQCRLPGRQQVIEQPVWRMFDVAHNPQGIQCLAQRLQELPKIGTTKAVFSMLNDKDIQASVAAIAPWIDAWYVAGLNEPRGMSAAEIAENIRQISLKTVFEFENITSAYQMAYKDAKKHDKLVIFGSFYTVAKTLDITMDG